MLATEDMNERRGEHTNSVSSKWNMVPLSLWSCSQVEAGVRLPWLLSRDLQVSFVNITAVYFSSGPKVFSYFTETKVLHTSLPVALAHAEFL